ncbi:MAG TPA: GDP-mannose 4,6-dehydratase [Caldisericia bacterium]|mgnify:CR=1 FL=1|nr:GDP-mannose 4,6-dehydratase [Caldisericia bacterium]
MNILVTGSAGFIGSHLCEFLVQQGHNVRAFVRYNSRNHYGWLEESPHKNNIEYYTGDIRDFDSIKDSLRGIDIVFHLAALIGIPYSYVSPLAYIKTNIEGSYNVLQASRELGIKRVVHTSTSEIYGTAQYVPIDEKHPVNPQSPYAATKSGADELALSFYRSFDLPVSVIRPFNTFGPRQSARAVIPTIITQVLAGKKEIILGNLESTRDMNYVQNTVQGFYEVGLHQDSIGEVVNVGSGREVSVKELALTIARLCNVSIDFKLDENRIRPEKSEVERLLCDATKANRIAGWVPKYSLEEGLSETIEWFKVNLHLFKPDVYNI